MQVCFGHAAGQVDNHLNLDRVSWYQRIEERDTIFVINAGKVIALGRGSGAAIQLSVHALA